MYIRFFGEGGNEWLSDETKWLAITHKSFDQGKRGFNDRLSYLGMALCLRGRGVMLIELTGKRIVDLQASYLLVAAPRDPTGPKGPDQYDRIPFEHPALDGLTNLSDRMKADILSKSRMTQLARGYKIDRVMRWQPRSVSCRTRAGIQILTN